MFDLIEFNSQPLRNFEANLDDISNFITECTNYKIIIATDYPERVKEILSEREIFNIDFQNIIIWIFLIFFYYRINYFIKFIY